MDSSEYFKVIKNKEFRYSEIVLNRAKQFNTFDDNFFDQFNQILKELSSDPTTHVILIWSEGKLFTAGINLNVLASSVDPSATKLESSLTIYKHLKKWQKIFTKINLCSKPVIVAVHSQCIGGGVDFITACDIRLCTADAQFSIKETKIAMTADLGTLQRIEKVTSKGFAREMAFSGSPISSERALKFGFVNEVYADKESMLKGAREMAKDMASNSLIALQGTKIALNYAAEHPTEDSLNQIALWNSAFIQSDDLQEAIMGFLEKRKPIFKNKL